MKRLILYAITVLLLTHASTSVADIMTAQELKGYCVTAIAAMESSTPHFDTVAQQVDTAKCTYYIMGARDELSGEMFWTDEQRTKQRVGVWQDKVTTGQIAMVFVKYVTAYPEIMNKPAVTVIRTSAAEAGIYQLKPVKAPIAGTTQ